MKVPSQKRIFIGTVVSVAVAMLTLTYATYSWFAMQREISVKDILLRAGVPDELQISLTGSDNDAEWSGSVSVSIDDIVSKTVAEYDDRLQFAMLPASSYAGFDGTIYQTTRSTTSGQVPAGTVFTSGFPVSSGREGYEAHYIDIPLYFRTSDTIDKTLYLKTETIETNGTYVMSADGSNLYKIARFAFLDPSLTKNSMGGTAPLVYASEDQGMLSNCVVTAPDDYTTQAPDYMLFDGDTSRDAVVNVSGAVYGGGNVSYNVSEIVIRVWIEGQDTNCVVNVGGKSFEAGFEFVAVDNN